MSQEHSAEWLRGGMDALEGMACALETPSLRLLAVECRNRKEALSAQLAAAEARDAGKSDDWFDWPPPVGVDEVIAYRPDAGVFPAQVGVVYEGDKDWFTHGCRKSLDGRLPTKWKLYPEAPGTSTKPTAAEVIAGAKKALEEATGAIRALHKEGAFGVNGGWANDVMDMTIDDSINPALAAAAAWEAAQR